MATFLDAFPQLFCWQLALHPCPGDN